ncbi:MAG: type IIL restriction-modification enzyme MmeI [Fusobacteriaceae bacterium]
MNCSKILDVRKLYQNESLANLYDKTFMPIDLRKAHSENDKAVWEAYGKNWTFGNESECIIYLKKLYQNFNVINN